jgi:hypothetical protein
LSHFFGALVSDIRSVDHEGIDSGVLIRGVREAFVELAELAKVGCLNREHYWQLALRTVLIAP